MSSAKFSPQQTPQATPHPPNRERVEVIGLPPTASLAAHLAEMAKQNPHHPALCGTNDVNVTYGALYQHLFTTTTRFNELGIGRHDRVAIVLPNGLTMALTFLAVATCAASAPLNPAYRASEYDFALLDLNAKALLVDAALDSPVREVAAKRGIPIIEISASQTSASVLTLDGDTPFPRASSGFAQADDIALILHTSGTTSRPKMVPLTQRNLLRSARNVAATLALSPADRCLNVMPLFHIHGLVAALLASLAAGGTVICTPGLDAARFFSWLHEFQPTWYTAVPTMHQSILARATLEQELGKEQDNTRKLRFVRSSSAPLPPSVMTSLEATFHAPVVEAYGMTEAAHQMASNPLPPLARKPGSVGIAAGPEVAIMAQENATLLARGESGEIVIRGENVIQGYLNNEQANATSFVATWFRTGDQGYFDQDGYLFITGRLKELINRGGEKIAPREVDEVLLTHPAVAQAVTFAMPDSTLGEEVAAAVVLRHQGVTEDELRHFVAKQLVDFKVPRRVIILDEIPKGATGKVLRIGLAEKLSLTNNHKMIDKPSQPFVAPRNETERVLMNLWGEILNVPAISIHQPFFEVGGDSMAATKLIVNIQKTFAINLSVVDLFDALTIADQATIVESRLRQGANRLLARPILRLIQSGSTATHPLFFVPGGSGSEAEYLVYARLFHLLGAQQTVYGFFGRGQDGLQPPHANGDLMVIDYLQALRKVQPQGPYFLTGECIGGKVAFEMARQLRHQGDEVAMLLLLNTRLSTSSRPDHRRVSPNHLLEKLRYHWSEIVKRSPQEQIDYLWQRWRASLYNPQIALRRAPRLAYKGQQARVHYTRTLKAYTPRDIYAGSVTIVASEDYYQENSTLGWDKWVTGGLYTHQMPGDRYSYLGQHVQMTAKQISICLAQAHQKFA